VLRALRLGWAIAETRGRLRDGDPSDAESQVARVDHALPLGNERRWMEQTIETQAVMCGMAGDLDLDLQLHELSYKPQDGTHAETASERLNEISTQLANARSREIEDQVTVCKNDAFEFLFAWDAQIQDRLAADSFSVASGYQLGRALAEINWALDPPATGADNMRSFDFLLGSKRVDLIALLATRLSRFFLPLTATTIVASVEAWSRFVAANPESRGGEDNVAALRRQTIIWHDLLLTSLPPNSLVGRQTLLRRARRIWPVLREFVPETIGGLAGLFFGAVAIVLFVTEGKNPAVAGLFAFFGAVGITSSGASVRLKKDAYAVFSQIQTALDLDLIKEAATAEVARQYLDYEATPSLGAALKAMLGTARKRIGWASSKHIRRVRPATAGLLVDRE